MPAPAGPKWPTSVKVIWPALSPASSFMRLKHSWKLLSALSAAEEAHK